MFCGQGLSEDVERGGGNNSAGQNIDVVNPPERCSVIDFPVVTISTRSRLLDPSAFLCHFSVACIKHNYVNSALVSYADGTQSKSWCVLNVHNYVNEMKKNLLMFTLGVCVCVSYIPVLH